MGQMKAAADQATDIMEAISPRGPGSLSNERWNKGHALITAAILSAAEASSMSDVREPCDCLIGDCKRITRRCREIEQ